MLERLKWHTIGTIWAQRSLGMLTHHVSHRSRAGRGRAETAIRAASRPATMAADGDESDLLVYDTLREQMSSNKRLWLSTEC
jgi:hypothetical protein